MWRKPIETFLAKHTQIQLHANIQSSRANLSSCWITTTTTGCRSQMYFMANNDEKIDQRSRLIPALNDKFFAALQTLFDEHSK